MQIRNAIVFIVGVHLLSASAVQADNKSDSLIQTDRYSAVEPEPTSGQEAPLQTIVTVRFPRQVRNVGQAISYTLKRSGYRLAPQWASDPAVSVLMQLPLPEVHRILGPMSVKDVLTTLAGSAYVLITDPVHRFISFEVIPKYRSLVSQK